MQTKRINRNHYLLLQDLIVRPSTSKSEVNNDLPCLNANAITCKEEHTKHEVLNALNSLTKSGRPILRLGNYR